MKLGKQLRLYVMALMIVAAVAVVATTAHATDRGDDVEVDVDVGGTTVDVGGSTLSGGDTNVSTGGNKTFAFAYGMGDVDINEGQNCMGSEQWGTVIVGRQTMELNPWCAALFYELNGKHEFAAKMRCDIKEVRKKYTADSECWLDQNLRPDEPLGEGSSGVADAIVNHIDSAVVQHDEDLYMVQQQVDEVNERLNQLEHRPAPRPQVVQQAAPEPEPLLSEQEKLDILGLLTYKGKDDE